VYFFALVFFLYKSYEGYLTTTFRSVYSAKDVPCLLLVGNRTRTILL
jgi:hypothetical protein